tara:strand:- start:121 stop:861 length:741 start_codon:yes stop_codon:yes gene_type:complete
VLAAGGCVVGDTRETRAGSGGRISNQNTRVTCTSAHTSHGSGVEGVTFGRRRGFAAFALVAGDETTQFTSAGSGVRRRNQSTRVLRTSAQISHLSGVEGVTFSFGVTASGRIGSATRPASTVRGSSSGNQSTHVIWFHTYSRNGEVGTFSLGFTASGSIATVAGRPGTENGVRRRDERSSVLVVTAQRRSVGRVTRSSGFTASVFIVHLATHSTSAFRGACRRYQRTGVGIATAQFTQVAADDGAT